MVHGEVTVKIMRKVSKKRYHHDKNVEDACKLVEVDFEYVTTIEGVQIFRKRK